MSGGGQMTDRRMDTSGFDHNLGSEVGSSPLAKRMMFQNHLPIKVMKNLKNSKYQCDQINEVEKSEQYTLEENEDMCYELIQL